MCAWVGFVVKAYRKVAHEFSHHRVIPFQVITALTMTIPIFLLPVSYDIYTVGLQTMTKSVKHMLTQLNEKIINFASNYGRCLFLVLF